MAVMEPGGAAEHSLRLITDGEHPLAAGVHRDNRRLSQHNALVADVDESIGCA
jgi:hypothetical protein